MINAILVLCEEKCNAFSCRRIILFIINSQNNFAHIFNTSIRYGLVKMASKREVKMKNYDMYISSATVNSCEGYRLLTRTHF